MTTGANILPYDSVTVAGLNPHDTKSRDWGLLIADSLPAILAKDVVGTISKVGSDVTGFKVGDRVMSMSDSTPGYAQSGFQEFAVADTVNMTHIPTSMSDDEAATIPSELLREGKSMLEKLSS